MISRYQYHVQCIYVFSNKVGLGDQNFIDATENFMKIVLLHLFPNISLSMSNKALNVRHLIIAFC